jgi:hypothetical protein
LVELILALALAFVPAQAAGAEGKVSGTLTLNNVAVPLRHVYATTQRGASGAGADGVRLLLSDVPLDEEARADVFTRMKLGREGLARIIEVVIGPSGVPASGALFAREFDGMVSVAGVHTFSRDQLDDRTISGRLFIDRPHILRGVRYSYDAEFTAPIPRPRTAAERAAALASPAGVVAATHLAAIRSGSLDAIVATVTADEAAAFSGPAGSQLLAAMRAELPADAHLVDVIPQVDGSMAATIEGHEAGVVVASTWRLVLERGRWCVRR